MLRGKQLRLVIDLRTFRPLLSDHFVLTLKYLYYKENLLKIDLLLRETTDDTLIEHMVRKKLRVE